MIEVELSHLVIAKAIAMRVSIARLQAALILVLNQFVLVLDTVLA